MNSFGGTAYTTFLAKRYWQSQECSCNCAKSTRFTLVYIATWYSMSIMMEFSDNFQTNFLTTTFTLVGQLFHHLCFLLPQALDGLM